MGLFDFFKTKKLNYKDLMLSEVSELRKQYKLLGAFFDRIEQIINNHPDEEWNDYFKKHPERSPKMYMASFLCNHAADVLESGYCHMYRGMLNPQGKELYELVNSQLDISVSSGEMDVAHRRRYQATLDSNIQSVG